MLSRYRGWANQLHLVRSSYASFRWFIARTHGRCASKSELHSTRALFPLSEFLSSKRPSIYDPGWLPKRIAAYVVGRPLWWTLEQLGIVGEEGIIDGGSNRNASWQGPYVAISLVEEAAADILDKHHEKMSSPGDALYTRSEFSKVFGPSETEPLGETDVKVLIQFLVVDKQVAVVDGDVKAFRLLSALTHTNNSTDHQVC